MRYESPIEPHASDEPRESAFCLSRLVLHYGFLNRLRFVHAQLMLLSPCLVGSIHFVTRIRFSA